MSTRQSPMRPFPGLGVGCRIAMGAASILCLASCVHSGLGKAHKVNSVQEAATVHIAPLSVTRWEDYAGNLQPSYAITPAQALTLALPKTFISQANSADVFSGGLQVGLPQSTSTDALSKSITSGDTTNGNATKSTGTTGGSSTSNGTTTSTAGTNNSSSTTSTVATNGGTTTTQTTTTQQGPGVLPPNLLPSATLPNASALASPTGTLATDPVLTYQAATAVYQEIQLLNNYVNDAVHQYGYVPYLARRAGEHRANGAQRALRRLCGSRAGVALSGEARVTARHGGSATGDGRCRNRAVEYGGRQREAAGAEPWGGDEQCGLAGGVESAQE